MIAPARKLRTGQKFRTLLTGQTGVVLDLRQIVDRSEDAGYTLAPRVLMKVKGGVKVVTLHPDVIVEHLKKI